jgi:hypothetical protein
MRRVVVDDDSEDDVTDRREKLEVVDAGENGLTKAAKDITSKHSD